MIADARRVTAGPVPVPVAERGRAAELEARRVLEALGWRTLASNVAVRGGEIDLVMADGDTIVFVEVRYRSEGGAAESLTPAKARRVRRAARVWLARTGHGEVPVRFDALLLDGPLPGARTSHLRDAF